MEDLLQALKDTEEQYRRSGQPTVAVRMDNVSNLISLIEVALGWKAQLAAYAELREKAEEYRNAREVSAMIKGEKPQWQGIGHYRKAVDVSLANLFAALDKLEG